MATICRLLIGIQHYHHGGAVLITDDARDLNVKYELQYARLTNALRSAAIHLDPAPARAVECAGPHGSTQSIIAEEAPDM